MRQLIPFVQCFLFSFIKPAMHRFIPVACIVYFSACAPKMEMRDVAAYEIVTGYRLNTPCGQAALNGRLPGPLPGDFYLYVLQDSLQIAECIDPTGNSAESTFPIRSGNDFVLAAVIEDGRKEWYFSLEDFSVEDSLLHIRVTPHHASDTVQGRPWFQMADNYIWQVNGRGVKLMKLYINEHEYAFVRGPKWSAAPVKWRLRREGKETGKLYR
ncbi:hypothetical protein ACFOTA_21765 [Chitinophaga sp. GCM10012297]|uniref:Lipoprotein n=1 Tax=Chitinophaga chungangae TaxID=2821488 RepID=A0ABS3YJI3_9BACT|nr:hypothetical protein [Chitinophaga chungangae]MBO9154857.1 hypothetical protein [Chitinophaga chungangae]